MALTATSKEPIRSAELFCYAIAMQSSEEKLVRALVTDEALQSLASSPDSSKEMLAQHRSSIEDIASRKHTSGQIEPDGSVHVTSADVKPAKI